ncbi:MAG TPA: hypothetical protein PLO61_09345 [Fimbriimonadaceae bacterium]|nr:hypothetical protein [Fimbriimonadaceae bacterium]HRJ33834.1 hypothetical protein [Fimbriimonadaceae bacterium]
MLGCRRHARLLDKSRDAELSTREALFLANHESRCERCAALAEADWGLSVLREQAFPEDLELSPQFTANVVAMVRVDRGRERVSYWAPAMVGATVAAIAVMVMLQLFSRANAPAFTNSPVGEARLDRSAEPPAFPNLDRSSDHK